MEQNEQGWYKIRLLFVWDMLGMEGGARSEYGAPELSLQMLAVEIDLEADVDLDLGDEDELEIKG